MQAICLASEVNLQCNTDSEMPAATKRAAVHRLAQMGLTESPELLHALLTRPLALSVRVHAVCFLCSY